MKKDNTKEYLGPDRRVLAAILSSGFLSTLGIGLFSFSLPLLSLDEKVSGVWLGTAFAGYYFAKLLVSPVSGLVADRVGPRLPLLLAALVGAVVPFTYLFYPSLIVLYAIQFVMGMVAGLIKPIGLATLGAVGEQNFLSRWFALHALVFNIALFIGPLLGGYLYLGRSIEPILLALSGCMGLTAVVVATVLPKNICTYIKDTYSAPPPSALFDMVALFLAIAGRTFGIGLMAAFYPILLAANLDRSGVTIGVVFAVPSLMLCIGLPLIERLSGGVVKRMLVVAGMFVSAGALFALGECRGLWQFVIFGAVMGLGAAISIPSSMALASGLTRSQGKVFGAASFAAGLGFLLGPLLGGLVVQNFHAVGSALQVASVVGALVCMPLFYSALREQFTWGKGRAISAVVFCLLVLGGFGVRYVDSIYDSSVVMDSGLYRYTDVAMGTVVKLTIKAESQRVADKASSKAFAVMRMLQRDFDFRNPNGSIGQINRGAGKYWVTPSVRSYDLLGRTLDFSAETSGVFDPTIGALTTSPLYYVLDEMIAREKKGLVDYRLVLVDNGNKRIRLKKQGMALDMGGVAKGTIIDATVKLLKANGINAGIVEAGGDFYCFGDREWTVGIRHPRDKKLYGTIDVREKGVCGSGDYEQFVTTKKDGEIQLQHHIIDPSNMESATKSTGVTVIAESAEKADALATALFIMGPKKGRAFMREYYPLDSAIWFTPDLSVVSTDNFSKN